MMIEGLIAALVGRRRFGCLCRCARRVRGRRQRGNIGRDHRRHALRGAADLDVAGILDDQCREIAITADPDSRVARIDAAGEGDEVGITERRVG
jgi:hypothetical protein